MTCAMCKYLDLDNPIIVNDKLEGYPCTCINDVLVTGETDNCDEFVHKYNDFIEELERQYDALTDNGNVTIQTEAIKFGLSALLYCKEKGVDLDV